MASILRKQLSILETHIQEKNPSDDKLDSGIKKKAPKRKEKNTRTILGAMLFFYLFSLNSRKDEI